MSEETRSMTVLEYVAEKLMIDAGWDPAERKTSIEWDPDLEDSQYAINLDIARVAVEATLEAISGIPEEEPYRLKGPQYSGGPGKVLTNTTFLSLEADSIGDKIFVGDLRQMVDLLDYYGIPDGYEVEGNLSVCFQNELPKPEISSEHPSVYGKHQRDS